LQSIEIAGKRGKGRPTKTWEECIKIYIKAKNDEMDLDRSV